MYVIDAGIELEKGCAYFAFWMGALKLAIWASGSSRDVHGLPLACSARLC
jgi:hypothetical protein